MHNQEYAKHLRTIHFFITFASLIFILLYYGNKEETYINAIDELNLINKIQKYVSEKNNDKESVIYRLVKERVKKYQSEGVVGTGDFSSLITEEKIPLYIKSENSNIIKIQVNIGPHFVYFFDILGKTMGENPKKIKYIASEDFFKNMDLSSEGHLLHIENVFAKYLFGTLRFAYNEPEISSYQKDKAASKEYVMKVVRESSLENIDNLPAVTPEKYDVDYFEYYISVKLHFNDKTCKEYSIPKVIESRYPLGTANVDYLNIADDIRPIDLMLLDMKSIPVTASTSFAKVLEPYINVLDMTEEGYDDFLKNFFDEHSVFINSLDFRSMFISLRKIAKDRRFFNLKTLGNVLENEYRDISKPYIEIQGIKINKGATNFLPYVTIISLQLYLLLHMAEFRLNVRDTNESVIFPWIVLYKGIISFIVAMITIGLLPVISLYTIEGNFTYKLYIPSFLALLNIYNLFVLRIELVAIARANHEKELVTIEASSAP